MFLARPWWSSLALHSCEYVYTLVDIEACCYDMLGIMIQPQLSEIHLCADIMGWQLTMEDARKGKIEAMQKFLEEMRAGMQNFRGPSFAGRRVKSISVIGLTGPQRDELLARLPVHVGDMLTDESMAQIEEAVKRFDEHLGIAMETVSGGQAVIRITAPGSAEEKDHI